MARQLRHRAGLTGIDQVNRNLNRFYQKVKIKSLPALLKAAAVVRVDMDKTPPLIPIGRTGNLRNSWFTTSGYIGGNPFVKMGFSAEYAVYVHEMIREDGGEINWSRPGSGAYFFLSSLKRNQPVILSIMANSTKP